MKQRLLLFLISCFSSAFLIAQTCGSDIFLEKQLNSDRNYRIISEQNQKAIAKVVEQQKAASVVGAYFGMQAAIYTIPVVVHVLHTGGAEGSQYNPSTADIEGAINYLNTVFDGTLPGGEGVGDIGIKFEFATRDPANNPTTGINRVNLGLIPDYVNYGVRLQTANGLTDSYLKSLVSWSPDLYYNLYLVNRIDGNDGACCTPFVAGYAQFPGLYTNTDGAVILAKVMKPNSKTLPHEIGHALGLAHPFEGWIQGVSGNPDVCASSNPAVCATTGDLICDTDPISQPAAFVARTGTNPCTGGLYSINTEHNFMNYTDRFTLFTPDQKTRMLAYMTFPWRASLASSWARAPAYPYSFSSPLATCASPSSPAGMGTFDAGLVGFRVDNRAFSSGVTATDPGYIDKSNSPLHLIPLSHSASYSLSADVFSQFYPQQLAVYIDYNNNGVFEAGERLFHEDDIAVPGASITRLTRSFTVPASAVANTVLRMRVINEEYSYYGNVITNGCYTPVYGQTEDFPVFIAGLLPVDYKYFKGRKTADDVLLEWGISITGSTKTFDVERSVNGVKFEKIGTVASGVNKHDYSYTDNGAVLPLYFYRLKQTDAAGQTKYSSTIIIRNEKSQEQSVRVTNPFTDVIDLSFEQTWSAPATIELIDLNGRRIMIKQMPAGQKTMKIDISNRHLTPGVYMLKVRAGDLNITKKIIKQ
ncbi:zinc-dependent metalloprotease [Flavitalea sp.]|nr:zinc-dependent metalloprotease [Flavitalea sp.]